jgi:hypothetical protein
MSFAPVACTVKVVATSCGASSRNVIRHEGTSPFGVAIAPEYCTDVIFMLTDGAFFGDAAGRGVSAPIWGGSPVGTSPSSCFAMAISDCPVLCHSPTTPRVGDQSGHRVTLPRSFRIRNPAGGARSLTVAARGRVGADQQPMAILPSENDQLRRIELTHYASRRVLAVHERSLIAPADSPRASLPHEPAVFSLKPYRPLERGPQHTPDLRARMSRQPPYDSATFQYLGFEYDVTKGALRHFNEVSCCYRPMQWPGKNRLGHTPNDQQGCVAFVHLFS